MKNISLLGSTGSIGTQTLEIARQYNFNIVSLAANSNFILAEQQAREFKPKFIAMFNKDAAKELKIRLKDTDIKVEGGEEAVIEAAEISGSDIVLNAIVGIAGLRPTLAAIEQKKNIALANKETLVTAGEAVMQKAKENGVKILPVDSEHSAIFQCINSKIESKINKILLTASGGPFFGKSKDELKNITKEHALKHPNWNMGPKITIDSATLMNKGLEVIEAVHLFNVSAKDIEVLVHKQSILHSAVEFCDNSVIGQMGMPDMKISIQLALTYPKRLCCNTEKLDLTKIGSLTFAKPDTDTFICLKTCIDAINAGGLKPAAANGANEMAVELFLKDKIKFLQIGELVEYACSLQKNTGSYGLEDVFLADKAAREAVLIKAESFKK